MWLFRQRLVEDIGRGLDAGAVILRAEQGYGKTIAVEQVARHRGAVLVRVRCPEAEGKASVLFEQVAESLEDALPGTEPLAAQLVMASPAGARMLLNELGGRVARPAMLFFEDAGALRGAEPEALKLVEAFIAAADAHVSVVLALRRGVGLRAAKLRSAGRLTELGPGELAFDGSECASLFAARGRVEPALEEVEEIMTATGGWPLAISAFARATGSGGDDGGASAARPRTGSGDGLGAPTRREVVELVSQELEEELLDLLPAERRSALVTAALPRSLDRHAASALGLEGGLVSSLANNGLFLRRMDDGGLAFVPIVRRFLVQRAESELGGEEQVSSQRLALGHALAARGLREEALEHMLEARAFDEAIRLLETDGEALLRLPGEVARERLELERVLEDSE